MKIAIIGAGFTGLAAANILLNEKHQVTIYEKSGIPGGLALGFVEKGWDWTLEEFYHHWFTNDHSVLNLAREIGYPVTTKRPKTSVYVDHHIYQLDSAVKVLQFPKLNIPERIRMGLVLGFLKANPYWLPLEKIKAASYLKKAMGHKPYSMIWEPQLFNKFGEHINEISLAWFWARIKKRTPSLAYPEGGFLRFAQRLSDYISEKGCKINYNASVEKIVSKKEKISLGENFGEFDKVVVTLPSFTLLQLCPQLPEDYKMKLKPLKGIGAMTVVLRLKKKFLEDDTYWLSICDKKSPVMAIVEHTNFMDSKHYHNEHLVYLGNYLEPTHPYYSKGADELLEIFDPLLRGFQPDYKKQLIGVRVFKVPFAQPIIPINYSHFIPSFQTPIKNLFLANMQQVYPWDRGTNYAVELGEKIAKIITSEHHG